MLTHELLRDKGILLIRPEGPIQPGDFESVARVVDPYIEQMGGLRGVMNTRYVLTLCTALVIGGALITGSAQALSKAEEKTPINDSWITAKSKIALFADSRVKGSDINVETTQGTVMIRGKVDSDAAKQAAEGITKGIEGVKTVKNELQVVAPAKREATDDKDDAITTRVNDQMMKDAQLKKAGIHVP